MIKIMKYGQEPNSEIFSRVVPMANVEDVVSAILSDVRKNGDQAVLSYTGNLTAQNWMPWKSARKKFRKPLLGWNRNFWTF